MQESPNIEALFAEALELDPDGREKLFARVRREDEQSAERLRAYVEVLEHEPGFLTTAPEISGEDLDLWLGGPPAGSDRLGSLAFLSARDSVAGYELVRVIGYGGMGVVYEAIQPQPRRRVALKLLRATDANPSMLRRFQAEAEILARLRHPAIAQVYEAGVEELEGESIPYLAMELIPGARTVADYVHGEKLDERARLELFLRVAEAVHHANEQGVVHRDLKPANILVDEHGAPKIIDFGIARIVDGDDATQQITQTRGVLGTVSYMSPEQLGSDDRAVDRRTDVYALGVVLYELLCEALPYDIDQASLPDIVHAVVHRPPRAPSSRGREMARDLETILLKALRKTREDRYDSVESFAADLYRYLRHEPIAARPPSLAYRLRLLTRRRPGLIASGLVAAILIVAGAGVTGWLWTRGERLQQQADDVRSELREVRAALGSDSSARAEFEPFARGILASVEDSLATAQSDEERARLLTWAVDTLQRLEPRGGDDPELLTGIAETYIDLGGAYGSEWEAGPAKVAGGVRAYRRAEEIYAGLVERDPGNFDTRRRLAGAQSLLAHTLRKLDRFEESASVGSESVKNAEQLNEQRPGDADAIEMLISSLWARGDAYIGLDDPEQGLEDSRRARELSAILFGRDPQSVRAVCFMAWSSFRIGAWYWHQFHDSRPALEAFAEANDHRLALVDLIPERPDVAEDLLWYTGGEIELLESLEGPSQAADRLSQILEGAARAARASRREAELAASYSTGMQRLGELLVAAERADEARGVGAALVAHLEALRAGVEEKDAFDALVVEAREWRRKINPSR